MSPRTQRCSPWMLGLMCLLFGSGPCIAPLEAHPLHLNTAQLTLRDAHLEVLLHVELMPLLARLAPEPASADPLVLAAGSESQLMEASDRVTKLLSTGVRLSVDGQPIPLELRSFPTPAELRALAGVSALNGHGELTGIHLEATQLTPEAQAVALTLPEALGPVLISFVQPSSQYTTPGATARFPVLSASAPPSRSEQLRTWAGFGAGVLALLALLGNGVLLRRSSSRPSTPA